MARRRQDRWSLGPALGLPEAAYGGPVYDLAAPDPVVAWVTFPDRSLEVEARVIAYTDRAVLVEWGVPAGGRVRVGSGATPSTGQARCRTEMNADARSSTIHYVRAMSSDATSHLR